jgi:hypothetical protein
MLILGAFVYPDVLSERSESKDLSGRLGVRLPWNPKGFLRLVLNVVVGE